MTARIPVSGASSYDVVVGNCLASLLPSLLGAAETVAFVVDPRVKKLAAAHRRSVEDSGRRVESVELPAGEAAKSVGTLSSLWHSLAEMRITRSDAVVAVGGGATTDVAGFAAATWLRGVRVVHVPTTLLGMVDAAVGGKTGVNIDAGKNLVGAFHPPAGVLVDLDVLATLPEAEWVNGMAEVVKAGFIADPAILDLVEDDPKGASTARGPHTRDLVERAIRVKADVVSRDLREAGPREQLNYGHTLGHAIEQVERYRIPHGHAVSIGLVFAASLGRAAGRLEDSVAKRHREVLDLIGLPTVYSADAFPDLAAAMRSDKKARGAVQRFVVLDGLARPGILENPDRELLEAAYAEVGTA